MPQLSSRPKAFRKGNSVQSDSHSAGGAIYAGQHSRVTLDHCRIEKNIATDSSGLQRPHCVGGALAASLSSAVSLTNVTLSGNHAYAGGAVHAADASHIELSHCRVGNNSANIGGGVSIIGEAKAVVTSTELGGNCAAKEGGGIYVDAKLLTLAKVHFEGNR